MEGCSSESTESSRDSSVVILNRKKRRMQNSDKEHLADRKKRCWMSNNDPRRSEVWVPISSDDDSNSHHDGGNGDDDDDQISYSRLSEDDATHQADALHTDSDDVDDNSNDYGDDNDSNDNNDVDNNIAHYRLRPFTAEAAFAQQILSNTAGNIHGILGKLEYHLSELGPKLRTIKAYSNHINAQLKKLKNDIENDMTDSSST
uniref:Uncharacterized protein n=1 Tax=Penaeus semisulcatus majanivirus TaxID=2984274 RepID=A0A9C7F067_9VIRU|nr:MAG: hypothetical protein [Penaeus semisulcatus majanivirus]